MRRTLQPLAVLLMAMVVVAVLAVAIAIPPSDNCDPSSRSAGKLGTLALYTWLGRLGLSVSRVSGTFDLGATDVLVDYDPSVHFSAAELDSVMRLVRGGGDLVLVFDARSIDAALPLMQRIGAQVAGTLPPGTATPAQPFDPARDFDGVITAASGAYVLTVNVDTPFRSVADITGPESLAKVRAFKQEAKAAAKAAKEPGTAGSARKNS